MSRLFALFLILVGSLSFHAILPRACLASDHADPMWLAEDEQEAKDRRDRLQNFLKDWLPQRPNLNRLSGLLIRHYDSAPDVIFTTTRPPGFPNSRRLDDDVALLTCAQGDCPLQENSFIDSTQWPRAMARRAA